MSGDYIVDLTSDQCTLSLTIPPFDSFLEGPNHAILDTFFKTQHIARGGNVIFPKKKKRRRRKKSSPYFVTFLALLSCSETFVYYTVQFYYPDGEKSLFALSSGWPHTARSLPKSVGGPQTAAKLFHFQFCPFWNFLFFFSIFPFFFPSLFPVGQQKFPSEKCRGHSAHPSSTPPPHRLLCHWVYIPIPTSSSFGFPKTRVCWLQLGFEIEFTIWVLCILHRYLEPAPSLFHHGAQIGVFGFHPRSKQLSFVRCVYVLAAWTWK